MNPPPPQFLNEFMALDEPLFTSHPLTEEDRRKKTIERYPRFVCSAHEF